ncbi:MAG: U32 family peptidase [Proteobacteria bacterium]|nr:U32 family peptidase [Pseudomonadota bacterium]
MQFEQRPEILAPAGNFQMMKAAVENGADAVYFGVESFNARLRADNFKREELPETMAYLHQRGVKGYLTLNILIFNQELEESIEILKAASAAGVDAILVQDLGLAYLANMITPDLPVHASTQMTITSAESISAMESLPLEIERIVTARELSKKEIKRLIEGSDKEVEIFVHGALCVAYSGQCLTSEALGGRSANRGECAQACRLPYELIVDNEKKDLDNLKYLLSPKDLAAFSDISDLIKAGVVSFKIEGRLKTPEYVAATVQTYRQAVDSYYEHSDKPFIANKSLIRKLESTFSRGFTKGYLHEVNHQNVVIGDYSSKRGQVVGDLLKVVGDTVFIKAHEELKPGDGLLFESVNERHEEGGTIYNIWQKGKEIKRFSPLKFKDNLLELTFYKNKVNVHNLKPQSKVWKTSDPECEAELKNSYTKESPQYHRPLDISVKAVEGEKLVLTFTDQFNNSHKLTSDDNLETGLKHKLTKEILTEQLGRIGNAGFYLRNLNAEIVGSPFINPSKLNELRRRGVEKLLEIKTQTHKNRRINKLNLKEVRNTLTEFTPDSSPLTTTSPEISVLCRSLDQVRAAVAENASRIYTDFEDIRNHQEARKIIPNSIGFFPATLRIIKPQEIASSKKLLHSEPDGLLVRNLASWSSLRELNPKLRFVADFSLNIANDLTAKILLKNGFDLLTPSYDLNSDQLLQMLKLSNSSFFEITSHQYMPMFHMEHCVFCRFLSSGTDSSNCGRPCEKHSVTLKDRKGIEHPIKADFCCRNTVFNGIAQSAAEYIQDFLSYGVNSFRLDFLLEDEGTVIKTIKLYRDLINNKIEPSQLWKTLKVDSKLGVTRGSLDKYREEEGNSLYQISSRTASRKPAHSKKADI